MTWYANQEIGFVRNKQLILEKGLVAHEYTDKEKDALFAPGVLTGWNAEGRLVKQNPPEAQALSLEEARAAKLREILEGANQAYHQVTACYSIPEERSWEKQKAEAEALLADENAPAPIVRPLAENRNIPVLMFARRILDNAARAEALSLTIIMRQQSYEDALAAAESLEAIQNIRAQYPAPEANDA